MELLDIPPRRVLSPDNTFNNQKNKDGVVGAQQPTDIDKILEEKYTQIQQQRLRELKKQKLSNVSKKIKKFEQLLNKLPNKEKLELQSKEHNNIGNLILSNLYQIKPYDTKLKTYDFEGNEVTIPLPKDVKVNRMPDHYFNLSKRAKAKAKNVHIEQENLSSKWLFMKISTML
jgi:predicted ribosome quality control (RQC) complex YloA/Tae2 family protein